MRLFTGLDLAPDVLANIGSFLEQVKPLAPLRWTPVENLHVTTKFIGEWPEGRLEELKERLAIAHRPFSLTVGGLGFFPNARAPRTFWAGIGENAELRTLAADTEEAVAALGIAKEQRPYSPHLTLARIPSPMPLDRLLVNAPSTFGSFDVHTFHLYLSRNSVYTKLASYALK
jgi:2'-5' RNA ligase